MIITMKITHLALFVCISFEAAWGLSCYHADGKNQTSCQNPGRDNSGPALNVSKIPESHGSNATKLVTSCSIRKFFQKDALMMEYLCDKEAVCDKYPLAYHTGGLMVSLGNVYTKLYCCGTDGCNSPEKASALQFVETSCLHSSEPISSLDTEALASQKCQTEMCVSIQDRHSGLTSYGCDTENHCAHTVKQSQCNSSQGQTICCCQGEDCNDKPSVVKSMSTLAPMSPVRPTDTGSTQDMVELNWMFVGALIGALVISSLVLFLAVMIFRRCRQQRALSLQAEYSYQQLTADLTAEDHSNDDKLLLA